MDFKGCRDLQDHTEVGTECSWSKHRHLLLHPSFFLSAEAGNVGIDSFLGQCVCVWLEDMDK